MEFFNGRSVTLLNIQNRLKFCNLLSCSLFNRNSASCSLMHSCNKGQVLSSYFLMAKQQVNLKFKLITMKTQTCSTLRALNTSSFFLSMSVWISAMLAVFVFNFPNITSTCFWASLNAAWPASCWKSNHHFQPTIF